MHNQVTHKHVRLHPMHPDSHTDYSSGKIAMLFHASEQNNLKAGESTSDAGQYHWFKKIPLENKSKIPAP